MSRSVQGKLLEKITINHKKSQKNDSCYVDFDCTMSYISYLKRIKIRPQCQNSRNHNIWAHKWILTADAKILVKKNLTWIWNISILVYHRKSGKLKNDAACSLRVKIYLRTKWWFSRIFSLKFPSAEVDIKVFITWIRIHSFETNEKNISRTGRNLGFLMKFSS